MYKLVGNKIMKRGIRPNQWLSAALLLGALLMSAGCRTTDKDIERWATTKNGPTKLVAVLVHDKYEPELRVDAALTLVSMKPRGGRRVGIDLFTQSLGELPPEERKDLLTGVIPGLLKEIAADPPTPKPTGELPADSTIPFKDAAFALLHWEGKGLVQDLKQQALLKKGLIAWAMKDFSRRMDAPGQKVGMQQMLRELGAESVAGLPRFIKPEAPKVARIAVLISEIGDVKTKVIASKQLVAVAKQVNSDAWLSEKSPVLKKANKESGLKVDDKRFALQLAQYQEEEMMRTFSSMKRIGQTPAVDYLLAFASDTKQQEKQRAGALAALEGNIGKKTKRQIKSVISLAAEDDTPDVVRGLALRRVGEMPRDLVIQDLYKLFSNDNWKVRWLTAELVLKMSKTEHVREFMTRLSKVKNMSISEPLRYGRLLGELEGKATPSNLADWYVGRRHSAAARVTALGYYYNHGNKTQLSKVETHKSDRTKVPGCTKEMKDCEWVCSGNEVETIGQYVESCIIPAMTARNPPAPASTTSKSATPKSTSKAVEASTKK